MDRTDLAGTHRLCRPAAGLLCGRPSLLQARRVLCRAGAGQQPPLRRHGAYPDPRYGAGFFHDAGDERCRAWPRPAWQSTIAKTLDACRGGRLRTGGVKQGPGRHRAARRGGRALYAGQTRFQYFAALAAVQRWAALPRHQRTVVYRGLHRQPGVPALFLHP